jgi:lipoprotein-anchoring transpeptidase ErfK/SrfK
VGDVKVKFLPRFARLNARQREVFYVRLGLFTLMLNPWTLRLGIMVVALTTALSASAQECFLWFCQEPSRPHSGFPLAPAPVRPSETPPAYLGGPERQYSAMYGPVDGEPFPIRALKLSDVDPTYLRKAVYYPTNEAPGSIIIDPPHHFLYLVQEGGRALRYGVGVGREGFGWSGIATVHDKREWPDWYPPKEMIQRQPELMKVMSELQSGLGMHGGPRNPLGARAMYLWQGNKDTLFRIHGTVEPWTIGRSVSSGCIRMINQDVIDLYQRAPLGAKVVVLPSRGF